MALGRAEKVLPKVATFPALPSARDLALALGKEANFAECQRYALGKDSFKKNLFFAERSCVALGKDGYFAECQT
jgi:hypothetical protein